MAVRRAKYSTQWTTTQLASLGLIISDPERALICTRESCQYALQVHDKRVSRHLCEKHQVPKYDRRGLDKYIASLDLADPRQLPPRPDGSDPHPHLAQQVGFTLPS